LPAFLFTWMANVVPIYAYKCSACGHEQDVLQKMSDPLLTQCPECLQETYVKQVTAAGFRLKGTGWYVTDFRDNDKGRQRPSPEGSAPAETSKASSDSSAAAAGTASSGSTASAGEAAG